MSLALLLPDDPAVTDLIKYGARINYSVMVGDESFPRFVGRIAENTHERKGTDSWYYQVRCVDDLESISRQPDLVGWGWAAGTMPDVAIGMVLDAAGWAGERLIDVGQDPLEAVSSDDSCITRLAKIATSDNGHVWVDKVGRYHFTSRRTRFDSAASAAVLDLTSMTHDLPKFTSDDRYLVTRTTVKNDVVFSTYVDGDLETELGQFPTEIDTYLRDTANMDVYAQWFQKRYAGARDRVSNITTPLGDDVSDAAAVAVTERWDRIDLDGVKYFLVGWQEIWTSGVWKLTMKLTEVGTDEFFAVYDTALYDSGVYAY